LACSDDRVGEMDPVKAHGAWLSDWLTITQDMIDAFASATLDSDPMHDDPSWAAQNSQLGVTIAYGFQTISLLSHLLKQALGNLDSVTSSEKGSSLNYGFNRLRLVAPVPVGARIRGRFTLEDRSVDEKGRTVTTVAAIVEIEGHERPALIAEWLSVWVPAVAA
jgi:acyl dehydratase